MKTFALLFLMILINLLSYKPFFEIYPNRNNFSFIAPMKEVPQETNEFFASVYDVVRLIPPGKVTSYGAIARYLGAARSSRMVGWAMNASHKQLHVPAHRVLNRNGLLTGKHHFGDPNEMQRLLESEGIHVENDQVQNFQSIFWDPNEALQLP